MTNDLRGQCRSLALAISTAGLHAGQAIGDQLHTIKAADPDAVHLLSADEYRQVLEELRTSYAAWNVQVEPIAAELRSLLCGFQDRLWEVN